MASNESILKDMNWSNDSDPGRYSLFTGLINPAMDAARKDEAVAFAEWMDKEGKFYSRSQTIEQLYTIFKQQNS